MYWVCLGRKISTSFMMWLSMMPFFGGVTGFLLIVTLIAAAWETIPFLLLGMAMFALVTLFGFVVMDIFSCLIDEIDTLFPPPPDPEKQDQPLTQVPDCNAARQVLADAEARWRAASAAENAASQNYARKSRALNAARAIVIAASTALLAAFLAPWTLPLLLAGVAGAIASYVAAERAARIAMNALIVAGRALQRADRNLAAAQRDVARLCAPSVPPITPPAQPTITVSVPMVGISL